MRELVDKINELISKMQKASRLCLGDENADLKVVLAYIYNGVSDVFPDIIKSYELSELSEFKEEMGYWASQLQRIIDACSGEDRFLVADVLYQETMVNLIEYRDRLFEKGLA